MVFPNSNLPSGAQPWVRDVQKRVETIEKNVKANEINSVSRTVQLESSFKRLDTAINGLIAADANIQVALTNAQQGINDAADAAGDALIAANTANGAAITANNAATAAGNAATTANNAAIAAQNAANTANSAIAILQSLTTSSYYELASSTWSYSNSFSTLLIDYYGSTYIDIPEAGGQRRVIVTAVFDVDMRTTSVTSGVGAVQTASARMFGSSSTSTNTVFNGAALFNAGTVTSRNYGGSSLVVMGDYLVSSSGSLSWNPDLTISSGLNGTYTGGAALRSVTVTITKV